MPTIGDMYTKDMEIDGAPRHVEIDDTAGQVSLVRCGARNLSFSGATVISAVTLDTLSRRPMLI